MSPPVHPRRGAKENGSPNLQRPVFVFQLSGSEPAPTFHRGLSNRCSEREGEGGGGAAATHARTAELLLTKRIETVVRAGHLMAVAVKVRSGHDQKTILCYPGQPVEELRVVLAAAFQLTAGSQVLALGGWILLVLI